MFPGVHKQSNVSVRESEYDLSWAIDSPGREDSGLDISVTADLTTATSASSEVADIVILSLIHI